VILIHQRHRQTDRQTDGQTDRRTDGQHAISIPRYALVHRAVKSQSSENCWDWNMSAWLCKDRLNWFGHVERKGSIDSVEWFMSVEIEGRTIFVGGWVAVAWNVWALMKSKKILAMVDYVCWIHATLWHMQPWLRKLHRGDIQGRLMVLHWGRQAGLSNWMFRIIITEGWESMGEYYRKDGH